MQKPTPEKPADYLKIDYLKKLVTKEKLDKLSKTDTETIKETVDATKKFFSFLKEFFTASKKDIKEKGFIMGPVAFLMDKIAKFGKELGKEEKEEAKKPEEEKIAEKPKGTKKELAVAETQVEETREGKKIEALGKKERIISAIGEAIAKGIPAKHCWDWTDKVYKRAGVERKKIFDSVGEYAGKDCGEHHAKADYLRKSLEAGDHIFVNNKNPHDSKGNHSVIFIGWIDEKNLIAKTASCPRTGKSGQIDRPRDLKKHSVTRINKAVG